MMRRFLILLLVLLMPLKALAASYGVCNQDASTHRQKHTAQSMQLAQSAQTAWASHEHGHLKSNLAASDDCKQCNLCHTACGAFVVLLGSGLLLPPQASQAAHADHSAGIKTMPSDPPYRPKWPSLA
jgi:hypothetical protein